MSYDLRVIGDDGKPVVVPTLADYVLLRMRALYGSKVARELPNGPAIVMWRNDANAAMVRNRITKAQVDAALDVAVAAYEWPPLDMHKWLRLCSPVRDHEAAFREAQYQAHRRAVGDPDEWSHPAVYWAADRFGWYEVRNTPWEHAQRRWGEVLSEVLAWAEWPPLNLIQLPDQRRLQTRAVQSQELGKMREILRSAVAKRG